MKCNIALAQMDIILGDPPRNLATVRRLAAEAASHGADILVLPELWSTAYDLKNAAKHAVPIDQGIFAQTAALAEEHGLHIVGSCLSLLGKGRFGNTLVMHGPDGRMLGHYSKLHLFRLMSEEQYLAPGEAPSLVETPWGKAGLAICYDLRFPELFRLYALAGAQIVFLPSEWPHPRLDHWRTLLKARAIENQLFVVACNRVGATGRDIFFGHSSIAGPWGELLVEGGEEPCLLTAEIDLAAIHKARTRLPILDDRRPDLY